MSDVPIDFTELVNLTSVGIAPSLLDFRSTTLESDHYVCVRETVNNENGVAIVDLANNNAITRKKMSADLVIMHPLEFVLLLRAQGTTIQIFNLGTKQRLKLFTLHEPVVFWKWLSSTHLGLVTEGGIYTWHVFDNQPEAGPTRVADRHAQLGPCQIINIVALQDLSWLAVTGIASENNRIAGHIQLYNKTRNVLQHIDGHVCAFASLRLANATQPTQVFVCVNRNNAGQGQMHAIEIDHVEGQPVFAKKTAEVFFPGDAVGDFPLGLVVATSGIAYILTKHGFIHLFDLETATQLFVNRITADQIFTSAAYNNGNGIVAINKSGQVLAVEASADRLVPYILSRLSNVPVALSIAAKGNFAGADHLFEQQFNETLAKGDYAAAAQIAASSERLRTPETIARLKNVTAQPGAPLPILQYFLTLLDKGTLNKYESIELARPVLQQQRGQLFEKWLKEDKLTSSEELGDVVKPFDTTLALAIYIRAQVHIKVVSGLAELGQFDKIVPYCEKFGYTPDYVNLIQNLVRVNPDKALEFAVSLLASPTAQLPVEKIADLFFQQNLVQQGTAFLLDALKADSPLDGHLQTKLLEINLLNAPQVADAILGNAMFSHYDRSTVAKLAERAGLYARALEHYDDIKDIKRCVVKTDTIPADWLVQYFAKLNTTQLVACLKELLAQQTASALQVAIQVATKYHELIGSTQLIKLFEDVNSFEGLYYYLLLIVNLTQEPEVVFKYIQCCAKLGHTLELERVVKDNNVYNGEKVKNFLKEAQLDDQLPLIVVCDRFDFVHDLVLYLYKNQFFKFIEVYVQQVNASKTPQVVAGLLDVDCDESIVQNLLMSVIGRVPIKPLVEEVEKRSRLKLLLPFLEKTLEGGSNEQEVYNTLAKIYIDSNNNPEKFLKENNLYDPLVVGRYCEKRDPYLAYIAYSKGQNDAELIKITNDNGMYKYQARYLLARQDPALWGSVLVEDNLHRRQVVDAVVSTGIPELEDPQPISVAVKLFMNAGMPHELIELLEKIILEPSLFSDNPSLQGLLVLTAIHSDPLRVMGYIERLDGFDVGEIGALCVQNELYEEAFALYDKAEQRDKALKVLTDDILLLDRGEDYANKHDEPALWLQLGAAQLQGLRIPDAIQLYLKLKDPSNYADVIEIAEHAGKEEELIPYLKMARETLREPVIDGALINAYAHLDQVSEIEKFLRGSQVANLEEIGDKLFEAQKYGIAKTLYNGVLNYSKLATTLVYLKDYQGAVDCARKASNIRVWKQVNDACIENKEFRLAQICGLNLIVDAEEMPALVQHYTYLGYTLQLIALFESGLGLERAHMGMFTELAVLYAKYLPERVMEHLKLFWLRLNIPKALKACREMHLYPECIFLYCHYDEWDNAALMMMEHLEVAFEHSSFKEIVVKVSNLEIYYRAITFYMTENPVLVTDLLPVLVPRVDLTRAVRMFSKSDNLPLIKPFLISVLDKNNATVNEAYHDLLIEEEDYKSLRASVENPVTTKFDGIDLAQRLEKHSLIFFREIAALIYTSLNKYAKAVGILKQDQLWKALLTCIAKLKLTPLAHETASYFVETGNKEAFVALLYVCYDLFEHDYVMELSWLHGWGDYTKPYEISVARENRLRLAEVYEDMKTREVKVEEEVQTGGRLLLTN